MPFEKSYDDPLPVTQPACIHLRSKAMYVMGQHRVPDSPEEGPSHHCWCNLTQHVLGPDQQNVSRRECVEGRGCYKDSY